MSIVDQKMRAMPEALSSTFEAYIEEGLTYEQAAKSLSIPIGTVRSRIFRVRELVQDC
jgi:RNA polymerase sigma-70 factor (ECF subfamily)